ncbi:MAG: glycosyltransferase family 39 protein [Alphaproteobacteria bacterium]
MPSTARAALDRAGNVALRFLTSPGGFYAFLGLALLVQLTLRASLFAGTGGDDAEQLIFSQSWEWGYGFGNPPLYTWLMIPVQAAIGPTVLSVTLVKFACLAATYLGLYRAGLLSLLTPPLARLAALGAFLIYYIAWDSVLGYSHSILLMALCVATYVVILELRRDGSLFLYAALGLLLGCGLLAKYGYGLYALALALASLPDRDLRARLFSPRMLLSLLLAVLVFLPHGLWILDHLRGIESVAIDRFAADGATNPLAVAWAGTASALGAAISFSMPLAAILILLFPRAFLRLGPRGAESAACRRLLTRFFLWLMAIVILSTVLSGAENVRTHYMFVLTLLPVYCFLRIQAADEPASWPFSTYAATVMGAVALVTLGIVAKYPFDPHWFQKPYFSIPYGRLADAVREAGFRTGTIYGQWYPYALAGNLRPYFPDSRLIDLKHLNYEPPPRTAPGQCLFVWNPRPDGSMDVGMTSFVQAIGGLPEEDLPTIHRIDLPLAAAPDKPVAFAYVLYPHGLGDCH